jgi:dethiobiotin synthetase
VNGLLVTGTDTEVGKSLVATGLLAWARGRGLGWSAWKPVESGTDDTDGVPGDATLLAAALGVPVGDVSGILLPEPLAPVVAGRRAGVSWTVEELDARFAERSRPVLVEGAGGPLVQIVEGVMMADLAPRWGLDVVLVAANRLGVLSHTRMAVEALLARGVSSVRVVLNTVRPGAPSVAEATNAGELERTLPAGATLLGTVPFVPAADRRHPAALAEAVSAIAPAALAPAAT